MKLIIDTEIIKDLIENEWGYEGIRDDLDEIFEKHGIPLDKIRAEIDGAKVPKNQMSFFRDGINYALHIIDKYRNEVSR